jgi:hypothetical protein
MKIANEFNAVSMLNFELQTHSRQTGKNFVRTLLRITDSCLGLMIPFTDGITSLHKKHCHGSVFSINVFAPSAASNSMQGVQYTLKCNKSILRFLQTSV